MHRCRQEGEPTERAVNSGLLPRPGRSHRLRRWVPDWDPADRSLAGQPEAGVGRIEGQAGSRVRRYARNRTKPRKQGRTTT
jgi:hypothetical protein